jgi:two-component system NtrC family sensor kinase
MTETPNDPAADPQQIIAELQRKLEERTAERDEATAQQAATAEVLKVISRSAFDLDTVTTAILRSAMELCKAPTGLLHLRDDNVFRLKLALGHNQETVALNLAVPIPLHDALHRRGPVHPGDYGHYEDMWNDPDYRFKKAVKMAGVRAGVVMPMFREDEVIGLFSLARPDPGPFTPGQIKLVQTFADQAAIAIENARLFNEVQARTKELAASLEELRTAQDRLVQTEKLASLGQLTAGIAHEIKNPLNFVNNFSALSAELIDELDAALAPAPLDQKMRGDVGELTQMLKSNLEKVVQHGKRADSIVKNMLLHSREGSGEHRSADINALVEESLNLAYHGARAEKPGFNVTLKRDLDPDAGAAELYPQEITRALLNLISNGFYAATQRKSVEGKTFEPVLFAATKNLGKTVEIRIRDNGTGIPPDVREKMFNPFFTTKPSGEGTGLGLSMSHDIIVKQHGGSVDVETEPGLFTEFRIVLPRTT